MKKIDGSDKNWNNLFEALNERLATKAEADKLKAEALNKIASQPAQKVSPLIYLIPVAALGILGLIIYLRKK